MRRISGFLAFLLAILIMGCGEDKASSQSSAKKPASKGARAQARPRPISRVNLPPPGHPVVGRKPPMPAPHDIPDPPYRVQVFASGLVVPWAIVFPDRNRVYVTERIPGRVRIIENGKLRPKPYAVIRSTSAGEGGLMGMVLHPKYPNPRYVYLMYTYSASGSHYNRISRFTDTGSTFTGEKVLVQDIRGNTFHDGGVLAFGPDGMLYAGTGDAGNPESAQNLSSLNGKILRMTPDGKRPADNPFPNSLVYAYGLRNVQGLAWNPANGDLWAAMHGPSGEFGLSADDAVFVVPKGANCGWPRVLGVTGISGATPPVLFFPGTSVPPGRCIFYTGSLMPNLRGNFLLTSLADEALYRVVLSGPKSISRIDIWFRNGPHNGKYGRFRAMTQGPDGAIYISTSNRDGRGDVRAGDDKILRIFR